ncbi:MAG: RNA polymerase sigma factor [Myxococcaceae bacterium]
MSVDEHLFRREAARIVAALTRIFGVHNLALAEDVTQDVLCRALEVWRLRGIPDNPGAWLMAAAKHRAIDAIRRERTAKTFAPELTRWLTTEWTLTPTLSELFSEHAIEDDQLRMMFSCCSPKLPEEVQVALVLNLLCGFSVSEIAAAFLTSAAAIEKRLSRGKKSLTRSGQLVEVSEARDVAARLPAIHRALYLLFNEGYHGSSAEPTSLELCHEALRLTLLLLKHPPSATPVSHALLSLMCFHAARLPGRTDAEGNFTVLRDQDRTQWDAKLISRGLEHLDRASEDKEPNEYQLQAAIAAMHAHAPSVDQTPWNDIVTVYDALYALRPSPVVALNRAVALGHAKGAEHGLTALRAIEDSDTLASYPFYFAAIGEFELRLGRKSNAHVQFKLALQHARGEKERQFLAQKLLACA